MIRLATLAALTCFAVGCAPSGGTPGLAYTDEDVGPDGTIDLNPMLVHSQITFSSPCKAVNTAELPSVAELSSYSQRLDPKSFVVVYPLNVRCLSRSYSESELYIWAKLGDPVAIYVYLYKHFRHIQPICRHLSEVADWLDRAYEAKSPIRNPHPGYFPIPGWLNPPAQAYSPAVLHRLPEAYALKAQLQWECRVRPWPDEQSEIEHGYDPLNGRPPRYPTE